MNVFNSIPQNYPSNIVPAPQFQGRVFSPQLRQLIMPSSSLPAQGIQQGFSGSSMTRSNLHILPDNSAVYFQSPSGSPPNLNPPILQQNQQIHHQSTSSSSAQKIQSQFQQKLQQQYSSQPQSQQQQWQLSNNSGVFVQDFDRNSQQNLGNKQQSFHNQLASSRLTMQSMPATLTGGFEASTFNSRQHMSPQSKITSELSSPLGRALSPQQPKTSNQDRKPHTAGSVYSPSSRGQSPSSTFNGGFTRNNNPMYQTAGPFFQPNQTNPNSKASQQQNQQNSLNSEMSYTQQRFQLPQNMQTAQARINSAIARTEKIKQQVVSNEMYSRESEQIRRELAAAPSNLTSASKPQQYELNSIFSEEPSPIKPSIESTSFNVNIPFKSATSYNSMYTPGTIGQQQFKPPILGLSSQKQQQQPSGIAAIVNEQYRPQVLPTRPFSQNSLQQPPNSSNSLNPSMNNLRPKGQQQQQQISQPKDKQSQSQSQSVVSSQKDLKLETKTDTAIDDDLDSTLYQLTESKAQFQKLQQEFKSASIKFQETISKPSLTPSNKNNKEVRQQQQLLQQLPQQSQNKVSSQVSSTTNINSIKQTGGQVSNQNNNNNNNTATSSTAGSKNNSNNNNNKTGGSKPTTNPLSASNKSTNSNENTNTKTQNANNNSNQSQVMQPVSSSTKTQNTPKETTTGTNTTHKKFISRVGEHRVKFENLWKNASISNPEDHSTYGTLKQFRNGQLSYTGSLRKALPNGYGVASQQVDGKEVYNGEWVDGEYAGQGILVNNNNSENLLKKQGEDINGKSTTNNNIINDFSKVIDKGDWVRYEGEFLGNLFHGFGALYLKDSKKLIGDFRTNQPNGQCTLYDELSGQVSVGIYSNGVQQELLWKA